MIWYALCLVVPWTMFIGVVLYIEADMAKWHRDTYAEDRDLDQLARLRYEAGLEPYPWDGGLRPFRVTIEAEETRLAQEE